MSASLEIDACGIPVEIGKIDRELGRLWEDSADTKTRASLINFVVYTEDRRTIGQNTELIAEIAGEHACRAILVLAEPHSTVAEPKAWIAAHCHLAGKGGRQICSEQITFHLAGDSASELSSVVFSHLDSDLPLVFWWQAELPDHPDPRLWRWVDRLIFDSQPWKTPLASFDKARQIPGIRSNAVAGSQKTVLCDLNWTRLLDARFAFASLFDYAPALKCLEELKTLTITSGTGARTASLLFLGWLGSRLGWTLHPMMNENVFVTSKGREISFELREQEGPPALHSCELCAEGATFSLRHDISEGHFFLRMHGRCVPDIEQTVHASRGSAADTLLAELGRGGSHPLYFRSLDLIRPLL